MKYLIRCVAILVLAFNCVAADAPAIPEFAKKIPTVKTGEPVFAFNGKNLDGFYTYLCTNKLADPKKVFTVTDDGMLHISGEEFGGLTTKNNYGNYKMTAEWKWGDITWEPRKANARDAGILVHAVGEDGAVLDNWQQSIEVQIIEGGVGDFLVLGGKGTSLLTSEVRIGNDKQFYFEPGGKTVLKKGGRFNWWGRDEKWTDTINVKGDRDVEKPHGEWNKLEVICDGDSITVILNGVLVNAGTKCNRTEGRLQIQSEGAEIFYRKFEICPLVK